MSPLTSTQVANRCCDIQRERQKTNDTADPSHLHETLMVIQEEKTIFSDERKIFILQAH